MKAIKFTQIAISIFIGLLMFFNSSSSFAKELSKKEKAADKNSSKKKANEKIDPSQMTAVEFEASLKYEHGKIILSDGIATVNVPDKFRYLNAELAEQVLVHAWGNPPGTKTLGMLFPTDVSPLAENGWGVIISFREEGYVKDEEAEDINYNDLLKEMKEGEAEENIQRQQQGYDAMTLVGWAEAPHYDKATHKLFWAKEFQVANYSENTLNYDIRVLGRKGYLVLNAVSSMKQLPEIRESMQEVLGFVEFNPGNRYTDFNSGTDKIAAYGIGGLIAGKVLAKVGFFKLILGFLVASKKFLIVIIIALGAMLKKLYNKITGNKEETPDAPTGLNI